MSLGAARKAEPGRTAAQGEFAYTPDDFEVIARTLHGDTGIHLPASKSVLVYSRIVKRLRALGLESFKDYCDLIGKDAGSGERAEMIAALTTNVTHFFREDHHFQHLKAKVLPALLPAIKKGRRLRIWSAGCSSGQEPYSAALTLLSALPDARSFDIRILATDINPHVIEVGKKGIYGASDLGNVPPELRNTWMEAAGGGNYIFDDAVRGLVSFRVLNFMEEWPMRGQFDVIFCRNVVIYFDERTQTRIWRRLSQFLAPDGVLYIGHSERIIGPALSELTLESTTTYRKGGKAP